MRDSNVGIGFAPCKKNCLCSDCVIERKDEEIQRLRDKLMAVGKLPDKWRKHIHTGSKSVIAENRHHVFRYCANELQATINRKDEE